MESEVHNRMCDSAHVRYKKQKKFRQRLVQPKSKKKSSNYHQKKGDNDSLQKKRKKNYFRLLVKRSAIVN